MPIIMGKHAGFCYGVKAAVDKAFEACAAGGKVWSVGSLIHNDQVMQALAEKGLRVVQSPEEIDEGTVILRSHGVAPDMIEALQARGLQVIDATCPNVSRVHRLVASYSEDGGAVIIAGKPDHPEVQATAGWCRGAVFIVESAAQVREAGLPQRALLVAQTTLTQPLWQEVHAAARMVVPALTASNTICGATDARQREAAEMAAQADVMVVVGSRQSANTCALYETCKMRCKRVYFVESVADIPLRNIPASDIIGITAGASTPDWSLKEVAQA